MNRQDIIKFYENKIDDIADETKRDEIQDDYNYYREVINQ